MPPRGGNDERRWAPGSLLASLTPGQQRVVLGLGRPRQYNTGDALLNQGDPSDYVVILTRI
jgi:hypothetical protein